MNDTARAELKVEPTTRKSKRQQLGWFGHLITIENEKDSTAKKVRQAKISHKHRSGKPRKSWSLPAGCNKLITKREQTS